tara:strand:+ start:86 stop:412 length:327 start_codon:yes stop_codon:yes gene_type:complete
MMNPKTIVIKQKKKLRSCSMEFNKKSGQYEFQIKEAGCIVHRETMEEMHARQQESLVNDKSGYVSHKITEEQMAEKLAHRESTAKSGPNLIDYPSSLITTAKKNEDKY